MGSFLHGEDLQQVCTNFISRKIYFTFTILENKNARKKKKDSVLYVGIFQIRSVCHYILHLTQGQTAVEPHVNVKQSLYGDVTLFIFSKFKSI